MSSFYIIVNLLRYRQRLSLVIFMLLLLSLGISLLTFFGTKWTETGIGFINQLYEYIPELPFISSREGVSKNTMGGALTFFPPLLLSLLWDNGAFSRFKSRYPGLSKLPDYLFKGLVLSILLVVFFAVLLTQSRGAWLGCAAGVLLLCILKNKRYLWSIPILMVTFLIVLFRFADGSFTQLVSLLDVSGDPTLSNRVEIWKKSLTILQDFPVTGISLGAFSKVYFHYFSSVVFPSVNDVLFHPHSTLLSVALEVGFPGLILYSAIIGNVVAISRKVYRAARSLNRVLIVGLVSGLAGFFVFGLFDAFTLGRNLEIIFWIYLGIATALFVHQHALNSTNPS